jgi:hypothetical protein
MNAPTNTREGDFMPKLVAEFLTNLVRMERDLRGMEAGKTYSVARVFHQQWRTFPMY